MFAVKSNVDFNRDCKALFYFIYCFDFENSFSIGNVSRAFLQECDLFCITGCEEWFFLNLVFVTEKFTRSSS